MQNSKIKKSNGLFVIYIIAILLKDYIFPRISYMANNYESSFSISIRDALLQFGILLTAAFIFFIVKYNNERSQTVIEKRERFDSFSSIIHWNHCSKFNIGLYVIIGTASYISFQLFKNVYLVINYSITANDVLIPLQQPSIEILPLVMLFLTYVIWAAFSEEFFYRSMLFGEILKRNRLFAYLFSVIIFALAHNSVEQVIQSAFLAIVLCVVFEKTASILPCIIIHIIYNTLGVINTYIYLPRYGILRYDFFTLTRYDYWLEAIKLCIMSVISFGMIIVLISKMEKFIQQKSENTVGKFDIMEIIVISTIFILGLLKFYVMVINSS